MASAHECSVPWPPTRLRRTGPGPALPWGRAQDRIGPHSRLHTPAAGGDKGTPKGQAGRRGWGLWASQAKVKVGWAQHRQEREQPLLRQHCGLTVAQNGVQRTEAPSFRKCSKTVSKHTGKGQGPSTWAPWEHVRGRTSDTGLHECVPRPSSSPQAVGPPGATIGSPACRSRGLTFAIWTTLGNSVRQEMGMTSWYVRHLVLGRESPR